MSLNAAERCIRYSRLEETARYWNAIVGVMLGKSTAQTALHFGANDLDGTITDGGELTEAYAVENGKVKCPNKNSSK